MDKGIKKKIQRLKDYFEKREDIVMAFLFGSQAKGQGRVHAGSDWDIAVYFGVKDEGLKEGEDIRKRRKEIWNDCSDILKTDHIDVVVLNDAAATLADVALGGVPLALKDRGLWLEFMLRVSREAADFREFAKGYFEIFWRSASLSTEDSFALERRLTFIEDGLAVLKDYKNLTLDEYQHDLAKQSIVERSIEKIMNAVMDASKIILASQRKPIPERYRDIVSGVGFIKPFSAGDMKKISGWVELRNFLAHEYLDYRWQEIRDFLDNAEPHLRKLTESAKKFLEGNEK